MLPNGLRYLADIEELAGWMHVVMMEHGFVGEGDLQITQVTVGVADLHCIARKAMF